MRAVETRRAGRRGRRGAPVAVQEALFDVDVRPERRYYRQILDALARSGFGSDPLEAERVVSRLCGAVWAGQEGRRDGSTEETFGLALVDYASQHRTPTSVALLRCVAVVAPIREVRIAAADAAAKMIVGGLPEPSWTPAVGAAAPGRCWAYEDVFGDHATVICEFTYGADLRGGADHAIVVQVDHAMFSAATGAVLADGVDLMIRDLRSGARTSGPMFTLRQVDPAWARALLARAFARTDLIDGVVVEPSFADVRALALTRLRVLPDAPDTLPAEARPTTPAECGGLIDEFLGSAEAQTLSDRWLADVVARLIVDYACGYDPGDVARVSPAKWDIFLFEWLPRQRPLDQAVRAALPDVLRAWSAWAARRSQLPDQARDELAEALDEVLGALADTAG